MTRVPGAPRTAWYGESPGCDRRGVHGGVRRRRTVRKRGRPEARVRSEGEDESAPYAARVERDGAGYVVRLDLVDGPVNDGPNGAGVRLGSPRDAL